MLEWILIGLLVVVILLVVWMFLRRPSRDEGPESVDTSIPPAAPLTAPGGPVIPAGSDAPFDQESVTDSPSDEVTAEVTTEPAPEDFPDAPGQGSVVNDSATDEWAAPEPETSAFDTSEPDPVTEADWAPPPAPEDESMRTVEPGLLPEEATEHPAAADPVRDALVDDTADSSDVPAAAEPRADTDTNTDNAWQEPAPAADEPTPAAPVTEPWQAPEEATPEPRPNLTADPVPAPGDADSAPPADASPGTDDAEQGGDLGYDNAHPGDLGGEDFAPSAYGEGSALPAEDGSGPSGWVVKGNAGSMLFQTPESPSYEHTTVDVWFESEEHAKAAGFAHWDRKQR